MRERKLFSWDLCREGMRQVKLIGIITLVIVLVASVAGVVGEYLEVIDWIKHAAYDAHDYDYDIYMWRSNRYILLTIISAFVMTISLFGFMNKRNESDFYYSLPHTRVCVFISFMAAVVIWNMGIMAAGLTASSVMVKLLPHLEDGGSELFPYIFNTVIAIMLTCGICVFAMTLTGTVISNVMVAGMFLFVPRVCMLMYTYMLSDALPFVPIETTNFLLDVDNNILWGIVLLFMGSESECLIELSTMGYSLLLTIFYMALALLLFVKRKSESATKVAVNGGLQLLFRLIPAFLVSLAAIYKIFTAHVEGYGLNRGDVFELIIIYVFAVFVYFVYEAATTRKIKRLIRSAWGLIGLVVLNLVFLGAVIGAYEKEIGFTAEADEVECVYIIDKETDYHADYLKVVTENVALTSDGTKQVVSECLKDTINRWKNNRYGSGGFYEHFYDDNIISVIFVCDGKEYERSIIVSDSNYEKLKAALSAETEYVQALRQAILYDSTISFAALEVDNQVNASRALREELINLSFGELYDLIYRNDVDIEKEFYLEASFHPRMAIAERYKYGFTGILIPMKLTKTVAEYINSYNTQADENPIKEYVDTINTLKPDLVKDEMKYQELSVGIDVKTIKAGVVVSREYYSMETYYSDGKGYTQTGEKLGRIEELASLLDMEYEFSSKDFEDEILLAKVCYYGCLEGEFVEALYLEEYGFKADGLTMMANNPERSNMYFIINEEKVGS